MKLQELVETYIALQGFIGDALSVTIRRAPGLLPRHG